ncbi:MAG: 50S ribosomal protein L30 [Firmicutes bacterium]|nr:50S ribosomal protein L30 [Bacillota bacterium]
MATEKGNGPGYLHVTLVRSFVHSTERQQSTVRALGLRKIHQTVSLPDSPAVRGMIRRVAHLLQVKQDQPR